MVLAVAAGILLGQIRKPDESQAPSTAIVGTYTYVYDYAGVLTDETMAHIDAMNASLFAQTGAQLMVQYETELAANIRDDAASNDAYWDAGYRKGQEYSKGWAAARSSEPTSRLGSNTTGTPTPAKSCSTNWGM